MIYSKSYLNEVYHEGWEAGFYNFSPFNPYTLEGEEEAWIKWQEGFRDGEYESR